MPRPMPNPADGHPHVVILGAGFAGLAAATQLGRRAIRVTLVDRRDYHLFAPLLYQAATAALPPADIAEPLHRILGRYPSVALALGEVAGIDPAERVVSLADGARLAYDRLIVATGSTGCYSGHDRWAAMAPSLKTLDDARQIRARLLLGFEQAAATDDPAERCRLMTTAIVGGGSAGVEMAGAIAELGRHTLSRDIQPIDPRAARIVLIEAEPRLLPEFPERLADYARRRLEGLGVTVLTGQRVEAVGCRGVTVSARFLPAGTVLWCAGVRASPAGRWLGVETDPSGRIPVMPDMSVPGLDGVYALGDLALAVDGNGRPLPRLAQVARQEGMHVGRALADHLQRGTPVPPFRFRDRGRAAMIGRSAAVLQFGRRELRGRPAWVMWAILHVWLLASAPKRLPVAARWVWRYVSAPRRAD